MFKDGNFLPVSGYLQYSSKSVVSGSVQKYPKSAENETNNDHTGQEVFKTGEYSRDVCQVYSGGKRVQKRELWLYSTAYLPML